MEAQEIEVPRVQTQQSGKGERENREVEAQDLEDPETAAFQIEAPAPLQAPEAKEIPTDVAEARAREAHSAQGGACEAQWNASSLEEDETQLAAIRELMTRAGARGIWLTLGEIAEATEFGEASISAQLRHLRKAHHGGFHVEKRRRRPARAVAAVRQLRDARRGPVTWEYRVLPPA